MCSSERVRLRVMMKGYGARVRTATVSVASLRYVRHKTLRLLSRCYCLSSSSLLRNSGWGCNNVYHLCQQYHNIISSWWAPFRLDRGRLSGYICNLNVAFKAIRKQKRGTTVQMIPLLLAACSQTNYIHTSMHGPCNSCCVNGSRCRATHVCSLQRFWIS